MILTELGLTFERDGADWRCIEIPQIRALGTGGYQVAGHPEVITELTQAVDRVRQVSPGSAGHHNKSRRARLGTRRAK